MSCTVFCLQLCSEQLKLTGSEGARRAALSSTRSSGTEASRSSLGDLVQSCSWRRQRDRQRQREERKQKRERENQGKEKRREGEGECQKCLVLPSVFDSILNSSNSQFPKVHIEQPYRPPGLQALRRCGPVRVILSGAVLGGDRETDRDKDRQGMEEKMLKMLKMLNPALTKSCR